MKLTNEEIKEAIEFGEYFLIVTKDKKEYDCVVVNQTDDSVIVEHFNQVKGGLSETEIKFSDIDEINGFSEPSL